MDSMKDKALINRNTAIDLIKGMGIFCMVAGHGGAPFRDFIYLFHMAIFFIASGYCYRSTNSDSLYSVFVFIRRKFKTLWFPYVLWTSIYFLCHNLFIKIHVYTDDLLILEYGGDIVEYMPFSDIIKNILKAFFFASYAQMGGAFWFLVTLMELSIGYCIIDFLVKRFLDKKYYVYIQLCISIIFLYTGFWCSLKGYSFWGLSKVLSYYSLFFCGYVWKEKKIFDKFQKKVCHIAVLALSLLVLLILNNFGRIALDLNSYVNPVFFLVASFSGWLFLYELAFLIQKVRWLENIISCIGRNTMSVIVLHFLCFKIVNFIGAICEGKPLCLVAVFPILYQGSLWWIAYSLVGVGIPIGLSLWWKNLVTK